MKKMYAFLALALSLLLALCACAPKTPAEPEPTEAVTADPTAAPALTTLKTRINEYLESGVETRFDSVELHMMQFHTDCIRTGLDGTEVRPNVDLVRFFCENSLATLEWLESIGIEFMPGMKTIVGGMWPRGHKMCRCSIAFIPTLKCGSP